MGTYVLSTTVRGNQVIVHLLILSFGQYNWSLDLQEFDTLIHLAKIKYFLSLKATSYHIQTDGIAESVLFQLAIRPSSPAST